jgi:hypothetical protein
VVATVCPEGMIALGVDDSLCRNRGLTLFGTGMHHDPLISSRQRVHVRWGHDWVILSLGATNPPWSPTKVWAVPVGMRLYNNRQGLTKGKNGQTKGKDRKKPPPDPNHRTRPERAVALIDRFARLFPQRQRIVSGDSADGGKSVLRHLPEKVDRISRVASKAALYPPAPPRRRDQKGRHGRRETGCRRWPHGRSTRRRGRIGNSTSTACLRRSR